MTTENEAFHNEINHIGAGYYRRKGRIALTGSVAFGGLSIVSLLAGEPAGAAVASIFTGVAIGETITNFDEARRIEASSGQQRSNPVE